MRVLAICGSPRKGNTYSVLSKLKEAYPSIDFKLLELSELNIEQCRGCYMCFLQGEENCPLKDDRDMILTEMSDADGIILASPVYNNHITGIMKNFVDRLGFMAHRPRFFDKYAMVMAVCGGFGAGKANQYMKDIFSVFGFNVVSSLELQISTKGEREKPSVREKATQAFDAFLSRTKEGQRQKPAPTLTQIVYFDVFKAVAGLTKNVGKADYEFYKDKTDYYYDTNINFFKKFLAKRIAGKVIKKMKDR